MLKIGRELKNNRTAVILSGIIVFQILICIFYGNKKSFLFLDEVFSYASANRVEGVGAEFPQNEWCNGEEWYSSYTTVQVGHQFNYTIPYRNQIQDVHPPLFYFFLHTSSSFFPETFSYWQGIGWNVVFFVLSSITLYFLGKEVLRDRGSALALTFLFGISYGALDTMVFIRMYMLMTLILLLHTLVYLKYIECEKISIKAYIYLYATLTLGVLTHYYFLVAAFFLGIWYTLKFLFEKKYKDLLRYLSVFCLSGISCIVVYPAMWTHIFAGGRGTEAQKNFINLEGYFEHLMKMLQLLNDQMFSKTMGLALIVIFILLIAAWRKNVVKSFALQKMFPILFMCVGYFMIVTKIAPYQISRYLMPIYPMVYLIVIGTLILLLFKYFSKKKVIVVCTLFFGGMSVAHLKYSGLENTFEKMTSGRRAIVEEYSENYAIYINESLSIHKYYDIIQVLKEYKSFYYIPDQENFEKNKKDMERLANEKEVILYIGNEENKEQWKYYIEEIIPNKKAEMELINRDETWEVYLVNFEE